MRLVTWSLVDKPDDRRAGLVQGRQIVDLSALGVASLEALLAGGGAALDPVERAGQDAQSTRVSLLDVKLHAPLSRPPLDRRCDGVVDPFGELPGAAQGVQTSIGIVIGSHGAVAGFTLLVLAGACAMGPCLLVGAEGTALTRALSVRVNGGAVPLDIAAIERGIAGRLAEYSADAPPGPGDILCASLSAHPPLRLHPGDLLECEAGKLGSLRNWCPAPFSLESAHGQQSPSR